MRKKNWLRYGLASTMLACGALGAVLVACGDDDSGVTANQPDGGGTDGNNNTPDTGGGDTGTDSGPGPVPAKIVFVHGATDYGPNGSPLGINRVCYATKTATDQDFSITPLDPVPHTKSDGSSLPFPGFPIGVGGPFPSTGIALEAFAIRIYLISGKALADRGITGKDPLTPKCNQLLRTGGFVPDGGFAGGDANAPSTPLTANVDFWQLDDIPLGTFKNGKTYLLALTGCTSDTDPTAFAGKCGPDPTNPNVPYVPPGGGGKGNLKLSVAEIDATSTIAADEIGVQVAHVSPQYQFIRDTFDGGVVAPFQPVFGAPFAQAVTPDAGYDAASTVPVGNAEIKYTPTVAVTPLAKVKGVVDTNGYVAANKEDPAVLNEGPFIPMPLNNAGNFNPDAGVITVQYLSEGKTVPDQNKAYVNGKAYTFVLVGDPQGTSLKKIHFLAFPNVFTPPKTSD